MTSPETMTQARQRVAERYSNLLRPGILRGDWDSGSLVKAAAREIESEAAGAT